MPGLTADDIRVSVEGSRLVMHGETDRRYFSSVDLPADVDPDTLKHTFKNGVLDIVLARRRTAAT